MPQVPLEGVRLLVPSPSPYSLVTALPPFWKRAGNFFFGESKPEDLWTWGPQALLWVGFHYRQQVAECFNLTCMLVKHIHSRFWDSPHPHPAFFTFLASRTGSQAFTPKRRLGDTSWRRDPEVLPLEVSQVNGQASSPHSEAPDNKPSSFSESSQFLVLHS